ncbi:MFS transporter [Nostoc sp. 'Peltigera membranacea cyanobiont' 210A]|uniref:MFS transporter n=1 Tax=Nostoc sp. 'Peltigera membranacea cyanobiont' 210A TaxID=2014529 RepID=UPI000B9545CA|nr:MFS transporter [Nostoc sp. 'Peltigera membranacea cyanobiont' 210A]OYD95210.1 MFS transporter [Nostoc sp. 'Peltigera membranacea cyanobiont' 210A]
MTFKLMKLASQSQLSSWLPSIHPQVWIFAIGRFLSEVGTGFTLFYAPIFFVNQLGLSATSVGVALGSASISGILGRIAGGSLADSEYWGRRRTLLLATAISAIASLVLATTNNFTSLVIGSLISGLGIGFYWPAAEAVVADASQIDNRRETFAIARLADNLGLAIGIVLAGFLIAIIGSYRWLFVIDAISFMVFFGVVYVGITETEQQQIEESEKTELFAAWMAVLSDRRFLVYIAVNIFFTIYISQIHSTLPLYFKNFVFVESTAKGFAETTISGLFAWHLVFAIICQLPVTSILKRCSHTLALTVSAIFWAIGFGLIWISGTAPSHHLIWVILALGVFAVAIVSYTPSAASLVTELAPENQRGVYFSINALCWAVGSFIGHPLGGWALDQPHIITNTYWLGFILSVAIAVVILQYLNRILAD